MRTDIRLPETSYCHLGVSQGDSLSLFLFLIYINDMAKVLSGNGADAVCIEDLKLLILSHADDSVLLSETSEGLQRGVDM